MNISQSFVTLCQKDKSFKIVGKSMQDSPNLTLNNAQHERIQTIRVSYLGKVMFQKVKMAKFPISDFLSFLYKGKARVCFFG